MNARCCSKNGCQPKAVNAVNDVEFEILSSFDHVNTCGFAFELTMFNKVIGFVELALFNRNVRVHGRNINFTDITRI